MSYFSKIISSFYQRKGKRILFCNGMTLNELSVEMEILSEEKFEASTLSRVLSGKRILTKSQFTILCRILKISKGDRERLQRALIRDLLKRNQYWPEVIQKKHVYTKFLEYVLEQNHAFIPAGSPISIPGSGIAIDRIIRKLYRKKPEANTPLFAAIFQKPNSLFWYIFELTT
jgi:hypothetical protein